ncbi:MAG: hypothetical protein MZW92_61445 [Comamonadaceae bacterium]|nr:hypothetical protein [Comamonadaceae bacterium]
MIPMKRIIVILAVLGLAAALERPKPRRNWPSARKSVARAFRGRHAVVIKNRDLLQVKKAPRGRGQQSRRRG